eukprot:TRINITY_DN8632_c0_g1_i2.p1 TRINITY_DN8632_c0_g1~~TRINITY_DN8632_c0_g1_i2.p1  ORF type:complete len:110 (+),score=22.78 TRINITY_DN8632_c0_g1_i2:77-406(+)
MRFRPCIDLHQGKVKQIVGSSLTDDQQQASLKTNFETDKSAAEFAEIYKKHHLWGGHVIMLGPGNEEQVRFMDVSLSIFTEFRGSFISPLFFSDFHSLFIHPFNQNSFL